MKPIEVRFLYDSEPSPMTDPAVLERYRTAIKALLMIEGDETAQTGEFNHRFKKLTFWSKMKGQSGEAILIWWFFENDERAIVLALQPRPDIDDLLDVETPPEELN